MRIGLNLLHARPEIGGGWNYIARLVESLGEYDRENHYVAFVTEKSIGLVPRAANFEIVPSGINPGSRPQRVLYENIGLLRAARRKRLDLMHWFANNLSVFNNVPGVVTVYDLLVYKNPSAFSRIQRIYLRAMYPHAVRRAALLLPMSEATARALGDILKAPSDRLQVIPAIVGDMFRPVSVDRVVELRRQYRLPDRFWIYVAHFYPHKNHARLLHAYRRLKEDGFSPWPLVLRGNDHGGGKEVTDLVGQLGLEKDVHFLPPLKESELPVLYSAAAAMIFPSLYEGGGIPVVEAMACGCPVIAAHIRAVLEYAGNAASYFDPRDTVAIAEAMSSFQTGSSDDRCRKRSAGLDRAAEFRPQPVVRKLLNAYGRAASR